MSFRRIPFNFATTNPAERQAELMRRFGVSTEDTMLIENNDDSFVDGFSHSSPRLQHRIPRVMTEGHPIKVEREGCGINVDSPKPEPKVRVIPIHIEGRDEPQSSRHRNLSGSAIPINRTNHPLSDHVRQRTNSGSFSRANSEFVPSQFTSQPRPRDLNSDFSDLGNKPRVHNIPISVEGRDNGTKLRQCRSVPIQKEVLNKNQEMGNGPCVFKSATEPSVSENKNELDFKISLKKIETILDEFKPYEEAVEKFSGVQGDKQYRYLDEMLTRCMLNLDDVETFGNEEVRKSRKTAVKRIQDAINVLDFKVQPKQGGNAESKGDGTNKEVASNSEVVEKTESEIMDVEMVTNEEFKKDLPELTVEKRDQNKIDITSTSEVETSDSKNEDSGEYELKTCVSETKDTCDNEKSSNSNVTDDSTEKMETCKSPIQHNGDHIKDCVEESSETVNNDVEMKAVLNGSSETSDNQIPLTAES